MYLQSIPVLLVCRQTRQRKASARTHAAKLTPVTKSPDVFRAALKEHKVVVADFHALWCGDCKMIDPFFKKYV